MEKVCYVLNRVILLTLFLFFVVPSSLLIAGWECDYITLESETCISCHNNKRYMRSTISFQNTPNGVQEGYMFIKYDTSKLIYPGYDIAGCLIEEYYTNPDVDITETGDGLSLHFSDLSSNVIPAGESDCLLDLVFENHIYPEMPELCITGLGDDLEGWCELCCENDGDCPDDGLYCNGDEICVNSTCGHVTPPCDDSNSCTTDPCDENNDNCSVKGCAATSLGDPCCSDPVCEGTDICTAKVTLKPKDVWAIPGEIFKKSVCLDNPSDLVGGIQFNLCEYIDGQPSDCMTCMDCELTGRTALFDCVVLELSSGCCRVILFSTHPAGMIIPGLCDIIKVDYESHPDCLEPTCTVQIPKDIIAVDYGGHQLPAYGYQGEVCFLSADADGDGVPDEGDNCPITPNGPAGGTCSEGTNAGDPCTTAGDNTSECGPGGFCSMEQEDSNDNGIGDVCECENHTDCDDGLYCNGEETCADGECKPGTDPCEPLYCNEEGDICCPECATDTDCDDGLYCNGAEICMSSACVHDASPCDDSNPCTNDPCDEVSDICLVKKCAAISPADPCCGDPVCGGAGVCAAKVTLEPGDVWATSGEIFTTPVCLDNQSFGNDSIGGIQFDLCEYMDGQPTDCTACMDCELTGHTDEFDCVVNELSNGCCRIMLFSTQAYLITPGLCNMVTVAYESHPACLEPTCTIQIPKNIIAVDDGGYQLPAYGYQGEVCFLSADADSDGVPDEGDNCPITPNGPAGGTCSEGTNAGDPCTTAGDNTSECGPGGFCSMEQEDSNDNGIGDACECENHTECDDGLYCNGAEICISGACVPGTPPCDDSNQCTNDPCDEDNDNCPVKECAAISPADDCCSDPVCGGAGVCIAKVTLKPEDVLAASGEILTKSICLDNSDPEDLVGGIQFDLCEYITDGIPGGCSITCMDCTLTERTAQFDCVVNELSNGCCRVILFSTDPGGLINPGECNVVTVYEFIEDCIGVCLDQIPENIVAVDDDGYQLPAYGFPAEVCIPCIDDEDCSDGVYCNGVEPCVDGICYSQPYDPCDDGNDCTDDTCYEDIDACFNICNATSPFEPCCDDPACADTLICLSEGLIDIGDEWANCGEVGVKKDICLQNLEIPIGGFQMDLCESIDDCLACTECELTERTQLFDCVVNELENGCCRVILFAKHPGGLINPGECDIVTIVYTIKNSKECCDKCIEINGTNIVLVDEYGYDVLGLMAEDGEGWICPFECGDVEPGMSDPGSGIYDCGDGDVDIFDILEEIGFALGTDLPDACQAVRANVPTGTPPNCLDPDGVINILDIMVIIDMALHRQDCCSYYYMGIIY